MAPHGWQLAVDLSELKVVGSVDLPAMAFTFAALNNLLDGTAAHDKAGFDSVSSGGFDQVYPQWSQLRNSLQNILGKTATNIEAAGTVVLHIVEAYRVSDGEARQSLDSVWKNGLPPSLQHGERPPPGAPPAVVLK
jgi:hypothetical protein